MVFIKLNGGIVFGELFGFALEGWMKSLEFLDGVSV